MLKKSFIISFLLILGLNGFGQTIKGEVYDRKAEKGLEGAIVWLEGTQIKVTADINGNFEIDNIPTGLYNLTATFVGYGSITKTNINVTNDTLITIKLELPLPCEYEKNENDKTCPICRKQDKVIPITYGFLIGKNDNKKSYHAGCEVTGCDPNWYCKRENHKF